jgi:hypothetical protein
MPATCAGVGPRVLLCCVPAVLCPGRTSLHQPWWLWWLGVGRRGGHQTQSMPFTQSPPLGLFAKQPQDQLLAAILAKRVAAVRCLQLQPADISMLRFSCR